MKLPSILAASLVIAGCSPASPRFLGQAPVPVDTGPHAFDVYLLPGEAQAVRTNRAVLPDPDAVRTAALLAMAFPDDRTP